VEQASLEGFLSDGNDQRNTGDNDDRPERSDSLSNTRLALKSQNAAIAASRGSQRDGIATWLLVSIHDLTSGRCHMFIGPSRALSMLAQCSRNECKCSSTDVHRLRFSACQSLADPTSGDSTRLQKYEGR
jgi:hypothetical protein